MARTAQPAALKLVKGRGNGTDSGGRKVDAPPAFRRIAPDPPEWLSEEAAAEWERVAPGLQRLDLLKEEDRAALAAYCETWAQFVDATRVLQGRTSLTYVSKTTGNPATHPAVTIRATASKELRAWATHFGLTPSAEAGLGKGGDDAEEGVNPFAGDAGQGNA